ncbi:MAG TPA: penicillin acylase family protein [Terracidiphilus sp.]|nr:penicillin acylase family protein [Terracidiphilus sp.]
MIDILPIDDARATGAARPIRKRKQRWPRIVLWTVLGLLTLAMLAVCVGVLWLRSAEKAALPALDGDVHLAGLAAPVVVRRDGHGVPHIEAVSQDDLFVAQGYVTAQDRLWQMDTYRRNANGELAEIMGPSLVEHDKAQRVLQFRNTARRVYANLPAADHARLDDYARGVNLFIEQHRDSLPAEFRLLAYRPQPWSGVDSVSVGLMMVQMLDTHWPTKLSRERIAAILGNTGLGPSLEADLYPVGSWRDRPPTGILLDLSQPHAEPAPAKNDNDEEEDEPSTASATPLGTEAAPVFHPSNKDPSPPAGMPAATLPALVDPRALLAVMGLPDCEGCVAGSNNWVVAGKHTASGKPLLSNDMHLGLTVPNIWFMADLSAPGFHAAGVTLPGMPFVIAGHNEHVAWGFTALMGDVQDLYLEKLDSKGNYQGADGAWTPLTMDHEVIHVRGGRDVALDVQLTGHGPLLNPILPKVTRPLALKWTLYDTTLNTIPLYEIDTAANWADFSAALETWSWPTQNVVYADDQGHIAYHAAGKIPLRPGGLVSKPIQVGGGDSGHDWQGYIPFDAMPNAVDPPSGFLATANSRVTTEQSPYLLALEWIDPYRAERIYKSLDGRNGLTPKDMLAVQTDVYSEMDQEFGQRLAYAIDHTNGVDARLRKAADLMRTWDGKLTTDSAAASIVTQARHALWPLILEPKLGKDATSYHWEESNFAEEEIVMHAKADWLPPGYKNWDALLTAAVRKGMDEGEAPAQVADWHYGNWHVVDLEHPLATYLPLVARIAGTGPKAQSGDTTTVKQVGRDFGPSQRFTMDWSNIDGSTENIVLGESSDPYSPYFRDQWNDWYGGTTFALPFSPAAVAAQTRHTLRLAP